MIPYRPSVPRERDDIIEDPQGYKLAVNISGLHLLSLFSLVDGCAAPFPDGSAHDWGKTD